MKHLYRAHELSHRTRIYGVIGDPVGHSLSPLLHNTGFVARKIDAVYLPFLVKDLRDFLKAVPEFGIRGFSVTIPHKTSILRYLKECDPLAAEIGAVNTVVVRRDGSLHGSNTDYVGILCAIGKKLRLAGSRVLIFGAGGVARAAAFALAKAGANVAICARREKVARELAKAVSGEAVPRRALRSESFDAVLNATPIGMHPHDRHFAALTQRIKLPRRHGPHQSARKDATPEACRPKGNRHGFRRRNVYSAGRRSVGALDRPTRSGIHHAQGRPARLTLGRKVPPAQLIQKCDNADH